MFLLSLKFPPVRRLIVKMKGNRGSAQGRRGRYNPNFKSKPPDKKREVPKYRYSAQDLKALLEKAFISRDTLDDLCIKFDLVFTTSKQEPVGASEPNRTAFMSKEEDDKKTGGEIFKKFEEFADYLGIKETDEAPKLKNDPIPVAGKGTLPPSVVRPWTPITPASPHGLNQMINSLRANSRENNDVEQSLFALANALPEYAQGSPKAEPRQSPHLNPVDPQQSSVLQSVQAVNQRTYNFFDDLDEDSSDELEENAEEGGEGQTQQPTNTDPNQQINEIWKKMKLDDEDIADDEEESPQKNEEDSYGQIPEGRDELNQMLQGFAEGQKVTNPRKDSNGAGKEENSTFDQFVNKNKGLVSQGMSGPPGLDDSPEQLENFLGNFVKEGKESEKKELEGDTIEPAKEIDIIEGPPPSISNAQQEAQNEKAEKRKKEFQAKYYAMDLALNQVVYDVMGSPRRDVIDIYTVNGLNPESAEKFSKNQFKIFSFLMQGDLFSKIWSYQDKMKNVQGPYMSYDMDIWNRDENYFSKSLLISPNKKDYFTLNEYMECDERIIDVMQDVIAGLQAKIEEEVKRNLMRRKKKDKNNQYQNYGNNNRGYNKGKRFTDKKPGLNNLPVPTLYQQKGKGNGPLRQPSLPEEAIPSVNIAALPKPKAYESTASDSQNKGENSQDTILLKQMLGFFSKPSEEPKRESKRRQSYDDEPNDDYNNDDYYYEDEYEPKKQTDQYKEPEYTADDFPQLGKN